jgi:ubiquinone/menaquinone biosynthesis C-methylase UbiE
MIETETDSARRVYDRLAPTYDQRWSRYVDATLRAVVDSVTCEGRERLLDLACGTGELERRLAKSWPGLTVIGADLSRGMLERAQAKSESFWVQAEARRLPLADEQFDFVICANSFHYFRSPTDVLTEMRRVLRPQGRLLLVDWCDDYLSCKLCSAWLRWTDPAFSRTYGLAACRSLLQATGLSAIKAERFRFDWLWGLMRLVAHKDQTWKKP